MPTYQPSHDPNGGENSGTPATQPIFYNNFWGYAPNANPLQGVNFNDQSAQLSGQQPTYKYQGQPGNSSYENPATSQANYQPNGNDYHPSPQDHGPAAQSNYDSYPTAPQGYHPGAQQELLPDPEAYSPPASQATYAGYAALASNTAPQDSVGGLDDSPSSSTDYEWVHEPLPTVYITMAPTWDGCIATRDSGTTENWISQDIVNRFDLKVRPGLLEEHTTFDGSPLSSCETVQPTWCLYGTQRSYKCEFRVVSNPPFDVLFGRSFLKAYPNILSSKEAKSAPPLLVLVKKNKEPNEQRVIEERRKKAKEESEALQQGQGRESSRSGGNSGSRRHGSSSKGGKKESKKH